MVGGPQEHWRCCGKARKRGPPNRLAGLGLRLQCLVRFALLLVAVYCVLAECCDEPSVDYSKPDPRGEAKSVSFGRWCIQFGFIGATVKRVPQRPSLTERRAQGCVRPVEELDGGAVVREI